MKEKMEGKIGFIAIIAVLIIALIGVGGGLFLTVQSLNKVANGANTVQAPEPEYTPSDLVMVPLSEAIKANLRESENGVDHLAQVNMSIALNGNAKNIEELKATLESNQMIIRDVVLSVLRDKTYEDLKKSDAMQSMGTEILSKLQTEFSTNIIVNVYFGEFFLQ